jgi:hypothetical protein
MNMNMLITRPINAGGVRPRIQLKMETWIKPPSMPMSTSRTAPCQVAVIIPILCHDYFTMDLCAKALEQRKLPFNVRKKSGDFRPGANAIQVMTMKVSKGLEFPVVALPGVGHMPAPGEDEKEAARVFYVAATRATQRLVMGVGGDGGFGKRLYIRK